MRGCTSSQLLMLDTYGARMVLIDQVVVLWLDDGPHRGLLRLLARSQLPGEG